MKRVVSAVLLCMLMILMLPERVSAFTATEGDFTINRQGEITKYTGTEEHVTVPRTVADMLVKKIASTAFLGCTTMKTITFAQNTEHEVVFAKGTFVNCTNLEKVVLPNHAVLERGVFKGCSKLRRVENFPGDIQTIPIELFYGCSSLQEIVIPSGVVTISEKAFSGCGSLKSVNIPAGVHRIWEGAFSHCGQLEKFIVDQANQYYTTDEAGVLFTKDMTELVAAPGGMTGVYHIPSSVKAVWRYAFNGCINLTEVRFPDSVSDMGLQSFQNCTNLREVKLPYREKGISHGAFKGSGLTDIYLHDRVNGISNASFADCTELEQVYFFSDWVHMAGDSFLNVTANVYYPADGFWTEDMLQDYGGDLTWIPYTGNIVAKDNNSTYTKGSGEILEMITSGNKDNLTGIKIDGTEIPQSGYEALSAHEIALKGELLDTLAVGSHAVTLVFTDGECSASILVEAGALPEPEPEPTTEATEPETEPTTETTEPETEPTTEATEPETEPTTVATELETEPSVTVTEQTEQTTGDPPADPPAGKPGEAGQQDWLRHIIVLSSLAAVIAVAAAAVLMAVRKRK